MIQFKYLNNVDFEITTKDRIINEITGYIKLFISFIVIQNNDQQFWLTKVVHYCH